MINTANAGQLSWYYITIPPACNIHSPSITAGAATAKDAKGRPQIKKQAPT